MNKDTILATALYLGIAAVAILVVQHFGLNLAWAALPVLVSIPLVSRIHLGERL